VQEPKTQRIQGKDKRTGARTLLGAAVAVIVLYGLALVAVGTPPGTADTGAHGRPLSRNGLYALCQKCASSRGARIRLNSTAVLFLFHG